MKKILFTLLLLFPAFSKPASNDFQQNTDYCRAKISDIVTETKEENGMSTVETTFFLDVKSGKAAGQKKTIVFKGQPDVPNYMKYRKGDTVFIGLNTITSADSKDEYIAMYDIDNTNGIIAILIIVALLLLAVGKLRGILSVVGLLITVLLIFFIFVPLTLKGFNPLVSGFFVAVASIFITIPVITGLSLKTVNAIAGALSGIISAVALCSVIGIAMHLSGIVTDNLLTVFYVSDVNINLVHISLAGMILSALGAVMDISISISSAINEFFVVHPDVEFKTAFKSAMEVGRDNLGSMVNTLIMAYVGSSLSLVLVIYMKYDSTMPLTMIFSHNEILAEILKSFAGCTGMLVAVPVTALAGVKLNMIRRRSVHNGFLNKKLD